MAILSRHVSIKLPPPKSVTVREMNIIDQDFETPG